MANYYEILEIPVTASKKEIESAIDQQYTYWHRLVTHHDPSKVEEANRSLRLLEEARSVLTNSAKRKKYDAEIGLKSDKTAGLADPQAIAPRAKLPSMNVAQNIAHQEPAQTTTDAWICGKCKTQNRIGLKFCGKCGTQIGRECIKCNKMVSTADAFCPYCGVDIAKEQARRIADQQEKERQKEMEEAARISRQREMDRQQAEELARRDVEKKRQKRRSRAALATVFIVIIFAVVMAYTTSKIRQKNYINKLIALSSVVNLKSVCGDSCEYYYKVYNTTTGAYYSEAYVVIQKFEFDENYLYVYFDSYGDNVGGPERSNLYDGKTHNFVTDNFNTYFLSVDENIHKSGYVRFNMEDIQPLHSYCFGYYFDYFSCIELFTAPAK